MPKIIELFEGLSEGVIPFDGTGYILNTQFARDSNYTKIEIIAFKNVKNILPTGDGVIFQSDGYKTFLIYEPKTYQRRFLEPYLREDREKVPLRWNEVEVINLANHDRIILSKAPYLSYGSFTVDKPESGSFVYYIYQDDNVYEGIETFIGNILHKDLKVPKVSIPPILEVLKANFLAYTENLG